MRVKGLFGTSASALAPVLAALALFSGMSAPAAQRQVRVAVPALATDPGFSEYNRAVMRRIAEINGWNVEIVACGPDALATNAPAADLYCGLLHENPLDALYDFSLQRVGASLVCLFARKGDGRFSGAEPSAWPCARVAYYAKGPARRITLERFAPEKGFRYTTDPCETDGEAPASVLGGRADLLLSYAKLAGDRFERIAVCGETPFYLGVKRGASRAVLDEADAALQRIRVHEDELIETLARKHLGKHPPVPGEKTVRLALYRQGGLADHDENGAFTGMNVEYARRMASVCGWRLVEIPCLFNEALRYLENGDVDLVGGVWRTPAREAKFDYPATDIGPLRCALQVRAGSLLRPNRPDTWNGARIGILRGSEAYVTAEDFLRSNGVAWTRVEYADLSLAEDDVREGRLDAVFALLSERTRDLVPLMVVSTPPVYFVCNRQKPWIREDVDRAFAEIRNRDPRFEARLFERHFQGRQRVFNLTPDEIAYVRSRRDAPVRVDVSGAMGLFRSFDARSGRPLFVRCYLDAMSEFSGLRFRVLPPADGDTVRKRLDAGEAEVSLLSRGFVFRAQNAVFEEGAVMEGLRPSDRKSCRIAFWTGNDAHLKRILDKTFASIPAERVNEMIETAVRAGTRQWITREQVALLLSAAVFVALLALTLTMAYYTRRVRAEQKAKSYFFSTVSHDIRTPLNAITGFAEVLRLGVADEAERRAALEAITVSGRTLLQLINDVLDLSKLEAGKMTIVPEPTDVAALVRDVMRTFEVAAAEKGISLQTDARGLPPLVVDPQRLRQILFNLVGNAVKFTARGGVTVRAMYRDGDFLLMVSDTGCGIDAHDLKKLMKPFVQLGGRSSSGGTGLGLPICRQLAKSMGGELQVSSSPGEGSVFTLKVPGVETANSLPGSAPGARPLPSAAAVPLRILAVDDSAVNLAVITAMLRRLGAEDVTTAPDGRAALGLLRGRAFDLVLTDLWMPEMDGEALVREIRKDPARAGLPVYAVTADVEARLDYASCGFTGILLKPITIERLSEVLAAVKGRCA